MGNIRSTLSIKNKRFGTLKLTQKLYKKHRVHKNGFKKIP